MREDHFVIMREDHFMREDRFIFAKFILSILLKSWEILVKKLVFLASAMAHYTGNLYICFVRKTILICKFMQKSDNCWKLMKPI